MQHSISPIGICSWDDLNNFKEPTLPENIKFNYTYSELMYLYEKYRKTPDYSIEDFMVEVIPFCGIRIADDEALSFVKTIVGFPSGVRFYRIAGLIGENRFTARIVPNKWKGRAQTNFQLRGSSIYCEDEYITQLKAVFVGNSLQNLAYITESKTGEKIISVNPLQYCPQYCKFCFKGMQRMLPEYKRNLHKHTVDELIDYIQKKFPNIDYSEFSEAVILTGRFQDYSHLLGYIKDFYQKIIQISSGSFDPAINSNQRIKISTHLIDSHDKMNEIYRYGIRRYIYPIETMVDSTRKQLMTSHAYPPGKNKGDVPFSEILTLLKDATAVFGDDNVEAVVMLGLDNHNETMTGLMQIHETGAKLLTYNIFRVYDIDQMECYRMNLDQILEVEKWIKEKFGNGFHQKVTNASPNYHEKYISTTEQAKK